MSCGGFSWIARHGEESLNPSYSLKREKSLFSPLTYSPRLLTLILGLSYSLRAWSDYVSVALGMSLLGCHLPGPNPREKSRSDHVGRGTQAFH